MGDEEMNSTTGNGIINDTRISSEMNRLLEIENLSKVFDDKAGVSEILKDVNLSVREREFLCILGPSGCGKTTLLRCIAGFEAYQGSIRIDGRERSGPVSDVMMVFQDFNQLFPWKTVEKNIQYPLKLQGVRDKAELRRRSDRALAEVRLTGYEHYYPHQLSGGMKQRVAIAKALCLKPRVILMDEPFAALDAMTRRELQNEILEIFREEQCTIIFVTHNIQEALILGTRSIVLGKGGRIVLDELNTLQKPVTPASPGYAEVWKRMEQAIYAQKE